MTQKHEKKIFGLRNLNFHFFFQRPSLKYKVTLLAFAVILSAAESLNETQTTFEIPTSKQFICKLATLCDVDTDSKLSEENLTCFFFSSSPTYELHMDIYVQSREISKKKKKNKLVCSWKSILSLYLFISCDPFRSAGIPVTIFHIEIEFFFFLPRDSNILLNEKTNFMRFKFENRKSGYPCPLFPNVRKVLKNKTQEKNYSL